MGTSTERLYYEIDGSSAGLEKASTRAISSLDDIDKGFDGVKKAANAIGGPVGQAVRTVDDMKDSIEKFAAVVGPGGAFVLAAGAGVAAVGLLAAGVAQLTLTVAEDREELERLGLITEEQSQRIEDAAGAVKALQKSWETAGAVLVSTVGPLIDDFYTGLTFAVMVLQDALTGQLKTFDEYVIKIGELKAAMASAAGEPKKAADAAEEAGVGFRLTVHANMQALKEFDNTQKLIGKNTEKITNDMTAIWLGAFATIAGAGEQMAEGHIAVQKVLQAVNIALSGAAAGWVIFSQGGLYTLPAAIATWAASAASAGWALSQSFSPPSHHPTPHVPRSDRREERQERREDRREARRSNRESDGGSARMGNRDGGPTVVQLGNRFFDAATGAALGRDSTLTRALRTPRGAPGQSRGL